MIFQTDRDQSKEASMSLTISVFLAGRAFSDKVDRLKLAEIVKQAIEEKTNLQESH